MSDREENGVREGAQETAEVPKVPKAAAGNEAAEADGAAWWTGKRRGIAAGIAAVAVIACIGAGMAVASQQPQTVDGAQQEEQAAEQNGTAAPASTLEAAITAESWTDDSSAFIAHVYGTDSDGNAVDTYHAFTAGGDKAMGIAQGSYTLEWVPAINADGSIYRTPEATPLNATGGAVKAEQAFEKVPADQVTADDLNAILDKVTAAVEKGDSTLTGDAGKTVVDKAVSNASANANADKEAVEAKKQVADTVADAKAEGKDASAAKQEAQQKAPASVTQNSGSQAVSDVSTPSSSGNQSSSGPSQASAHEHNWVAQTKNIHHDAVYQTQYENVHHNAVYEYRTVCVACGSLTPTSAHMEQHALNGESTQRRSEKVCTQEAYDEQVSKQVLVSAAYDETVTTGYKCSTCGATK